MECGEIRMMDRADLVDRLGDFQELPFPCEKSASIRDSEASFSPCAVKKKGESISNTCAVPEIIRAPSTVISDGRVRPSQSAQKDQPSDPREYSGQTHLQPRRVPA